jgi:hypothetical protein
MVIFTLEASLSALSCHRLIALLNSCLQNDSEFNPFSGAHAA